MSHGDNRRERAQGDPAGAGGETGLLAIVATLVGYGVDFVVIGGFAVGHHGYPRATNDVDVVPAPDPENLEKLWQALVEVEAQPLALGYFRLEELPIPFSRDGLLRTWLTYVRSARQTKTPLRRSSSRNDASPKGRDARVAPRPDAAGGGHQATLL